MVGPVCFQQVFQCFQAVLLVPAPRAKDQRFCKPGQEMKILHGEIVGDSGSPVLLLELVVLPTIGTDHGIHRIRLEVRHLLGQIESPAEKMSSIRESLTDSGGFRHVADITHSLMPVSQVVRVCDVGEDVIDWRVDVDLGRDTVRQTQDMVLRHGGPFPQIIRPTGA
jgi:hypothetical protein